MIRLPDIPFDVEEAKRKIGGRPVVLSVSGGKDSTATGLVLKEAGIPFRCVHMDTGWEHPDTEHYVREVLPGILGPIGIIQGKHGGMEALCLKKGMFASRKRRFCTQELKVFAFLTWKKWFEAEHDEEIVNAVGIRADESRSRSRMTEWEWGEGLDVDVWRPIIRFTLDDIIEVHRRHDVRPNPLYLKGATRVGCWPCIFMRKSELAMMVDIDPGRVDRIRRLEADVKAAAVERLAKRGESLESLGYSAPAFFRARARVVDPETGKKVWGRHDWGIDRVIEWATTKANSGQLELFAADGTNAGCARWGMCETH